MLPKINRIKKKKDFEIIFKKGASSKNSLLVLKILKNNFSESRFGFIVSQKVSKKATARNKVRRRLAEIISAEFKNIKDGLDIVLISLPGIEKKDFLEMKDALQKLLSKAGAAKKQQNV
jgi:ribonuclease P protein component